MNRSIQWGIGWTAILILLGSWNAAARNRDIETSIGPATSNFVPVPPEPQPPTWAERRAGQAWEGAGALGEAVSSAGDPAEAAAKSLELGQRGAATAKSVREALVQSGEAVVDSGGRLRNARTNQIISKSQLQRNAGQMNEWGASMNRAKQGSGWTKVRKGLDKAGQLGAMAERAGDAGTGAGELVGGDYVGAAKTGANHVLSNGAEAVGGLAGAKAGAAALSPFGPQAALVGGVLGGAGGALGAGKVYTEHVKPAMEQGYDNLAGTYYGDPRGKDAQGRADIGAEQSNLAPDALPRYGEVQRAKELLSPDAFEVWKRVWGGAGRAESAVGPMRPEDLRDPALEAAVQDIRKGIYDSNVMHGRARGLPDMDPKGELAAAEKAILDRFAELERGVEREVSEEERIRREWARREELDQLRQEQERIAAERERRRREAETAAAMIGIAGAILGTMSQPPAQVNQPYPAPNTQQPRKGHRRPDGTWHEGSN